MFEKFVQSDDGVHARTHTHTLPSLGSVSFLHQTLANSSSLS